MHPKFSNNWEIYGNHYSKEIRSPCGGCEEIRLRLSNSKLPEVHLI